MAEDVVIRYRAEVDEATRKLDLFAKENEQLAVGTTKAAKAIDNTTKSVDKLEKEVTDTGKKLKDVSTQSQDFGKKTNTAFSQVGGALKTFAAGAAVALGAAFSVQAIQQFASASIDAFLDAEKNAERLKFAITSIGGESEAAFDRLIRQSAQLQDITIFSDDSIQQAQAALSAFGLTSDEIEKTIPLLADFATITGVDIAQAAQQLGAGLEGAGREFKKYGIEVSATVSRQENLNAILKGFGQFTGAAEEATKTLTGQLAQLNNRSDELQESIGAKLAPAFVRAKVAAFEFFNELLGGNAKQKEFDTLSGNLKGLVADIDGVADAIQRNTPDLNFFEKIQRELASGGVQGQRGERAIAFAKLTESILQASEASQKLVTSQESLTVEGIKLLGIQQKIDEQFKLGNIDRLQQQTATNILNEQVKRLGTTYKDFQFAQKQAAEALKEGKKEIDDTRVATDDLIRSLEKIRDIQVTPLQNIFLESEKGIQSFRDSVKKTSEDVREDAVISFEAELDQKNKDRLAKDAADAGEIAGVEFGESFAESLDQFFTNNAEIINATQQLVGELSQLYSALAAGQLEDIERVKEAELNAIDVQLKANDEALERRRISENEAANNEKKLIAEKLRIEEQAAKKEREIKRKAAILDKAAALVQIIVNTAVAVTAALKTGIAGLPLAALYAALGATQAAVVIAQPIPYAKGTKSAKGGLSRVGEIGEEVMYVPEGSKVLPNNKTKQFAPALDAMFDNKFDQYVLNRYVNPALQKQRAAMESERSGSFAENLGRSITLNSKSGGTDPNLVRAIRQGYINADEFGQAVAKYLPTSDIYRR